MLIENQSDLDAFCAVLAKEPYFAIDTEFLRERTYYPKLCLIQIAFPGHDAVAIDPFGEGMDLAPLWEIILDASKLKVFHAAKQDLELIFYETGRVLKNVFDTQIAAMVCGYGDQIGFQRLVERICNESLDKGHQYTDWSKRPLKAAQLHYALNDVIYLLPIYDHLLEELKNRGRKSWIDEEMESLTANSTYDPDPMQVWEKMKIKNLKPKTLAVVQSLAAWRESEARARNLPRNRIVRDETLIDLAVQMPKSNDELERIRGLGGEYRSGKRKDVLLAAIKTGANAKKEDWPRRKKREPLSDPYVPAFEMLRMLLKIRCAEHEIVPRLVADTSDLESLAREDHPDIPALKGWRAEIFGRDALRLKSGELTFSLRNGSVVVN